MFTDASSVIASETISFLRVDCSSLVSTKFHVCFWVLHVSLRSHIALA